MEKRRFAKGNFDVSLLGFGTMRLPHAQGKPAEILTKEATAMYDHAYESGVNYFDTAYMYHDNASESFTGKTLKRYPRDSFYLATKLPPWYIEKQSDLERIFDEQLRNCQVDYFDFYLLHCFTRTTFLTFEKYGAHEFLLEQKKKGKLRYYGFSIHDNVELMEKVLNRWDFDFAQIQLNYLDWDVINSKGLYNSLEKRGIPAIIMEPVRGGTLAKLPEASAKVLTDFAPEKSIASWAMRYAADLPGVLTVLSGMSNINQVKDNIATYNSFAPLSADERKTIDTAVEIYRKNSTIPCTTCGYCMPCPVGVNIPESFGIYNIMKNGGDQVSFTNEYRNIGSGSRPDDCTNCRVCLSHCPQHIKIPEMLKEVAQVYECMASSEG